MSTALGPSISAPRAQPAPRLRWKELTGGAISTLVPGVLLTLFVLVPQPPYGPQPFHDAWRRHLLLGVALLIWALALLVSRRLPRLSLIDGPLALVLLTEVGSVLVMPDRRLGIEPVLDLLASILIFKALADCPGLSPRSLARSLALMALAVAAACLWYVWLQWLDWRALALAVPDAHAGLLPPTVPRVLAVGTNPNIIAPVMALTLPLYLLAVLRSAGWWRIAAIAGAAVVQIAVFFTLSRAAWAGELAGLGVTGLLLLYAAGRLRRPPARVVLAFGSLTLAGIFMAALLLLAGFRPLWLFRSSLGARSDFRAAAIDLIRQRPLLGNGPGSFSLLYPQISNGDPVGAVHSHNVILQTVVDSGIAGLLAALLVAVVLAVAFVKAWRRASARSLGLLACAAGSFACFAVGGMGDALELFPEILFILGAMAAMVLRMAQASAHPYPVEGRAEPRSSPANQAPPAGLLLFRIAGAAAVALLASVILVLYSRADLAERDYARSLDLAGNQRWPEAAAEADRAIRLDSTMPLYSVQAALTRAIEAESIAPGAPEAHPGSGQAEGAEALRAQAIGLLQRALALEPRSPATRLDLAALYLLGGQDQAAIQQMPEMLEGAGRVPVLLLAAGVIQEPSQPQKAIEAYAAALADNPRMADSPFWKETQFRQDNFREIMRQAIARAATEGSIAGPAATREIIQDAAIISGDKAASEHGEDYVARINRGRHLTQARDFDGARLLLERAAKERPDDPSARLALGELEAAQGDLSGARRQWLAGAYLGDAASVLHLGDTSPGGKVPARIHALGEQALIAMWGRQFGLIDQHYRFAYRRQEPVPILLPGDWLNGLPQIYFDMKMAVARWQSPASGR